MITHRLSQPKPILTLDELRAEAHRLNTDVNQIGKALREAYEADPHRYADVQTLRGYRRLMVKRNAAERALATAEKRSAKMESHRLLLVMDERGI